MPIANVATGVTKHRGDLSLYMLNLQILLQPRLLHLQRVVQPPQWQRYHPCPLLELHRPVVGAPLSGSAATLRLRSVGLSEVVAAAASGRDGERKRRTRKEALLLLLHRAQLVAVVPHLKGRAPAANTRTITPRLGSTKALVVVRLVPNP